MATVQLRHFVYVLKFPLLKAGATIEGAPMIMDLDADFILRGRAVHIQSTSPGLAGQSDLNNYFDRITGPDSGDYLSQAMLRFANECPTFGQYGNPLPVRQPIVYPRGGQITIDVQNQGADDYTNLEVYFIGQKVYRPGQIPCATYPESVSPLPFIYPGYGYVNGQQTNYIQLQQQDQVLLNKLNVLNDADFVVRSISIGSMNLGNAAAQYFQCYIQLRDSDEKAFSNLPVHVDVMYGAYGSVTSSVAPGTSTGNYHPGLVTPEIYIPANQWMYYDLYRQDNYIGAGTLSPVNLYVAFNGMKVFHRL